MTWFENEAQNNDPGGLRGENKWRWDKEKINDALIKLYNPSIAAPDPTTPFESASSPAILLISLGKAVCFDDMYSEVLAILRSRAGVTEVTCLASAMQHLSKPHKEYTAIVITDSSVKEKEFLAIQEKLVKYTLAGGTVILGFDFCRFDTCRNLEHFLTNTWSLDWKVVENSTVATFTLNAQSNLVFMRHKLPSLYEMKAALLLSDVKPEDRVYIENANSVLSGAVFSKYGDGYLGWIGHTSTMGNAGTSELLLPMCGV